MGDKRLIFWSFRTWRHDPLDLNPGRVDGDQKGTSVLLIADFLFFATEVNAHVWAALPGNVGAEDKVLSEF